MKKLISINKLSEMLDISRKSLYAMASARLLPYYKVGRLVRFSEEEVLKHLEKHKREAIDESEMKKSTSQTLTTIKRKQMDSTELDRLIDKTIAQATNKS